MGVATLRECRLMENLDDDALRQVADFFSAFSVPMRLKILNALRGGERNVGELTAELGGSQANISKHLGMLTQRGLIAKSARGTSAFYRIVDPRIFELCDLVCVQVGRRLEEQVESRNTFLRVLTAGKGAARKKPSRR